MVWERILSVSGRGSVEKYRALRIYNVEIKVYQFYNRSGHKHSKFLPVLS